MIKAFISNFFIIILLVTSCTSEEKKQEKKASDWVTVDLPYTFNSKEAENLSVEAFKLSEEGQTEKAIILYKKAIEMEPGNPKLFFDLAGNYIQENRVEEAIEALTKAISLDTTYAPFYSNRGLLYYQNYKDDLAISDYEKAIQLEPDHYVYHFNIALAYFTTGKKQEACSSLTLARKFGLTVAEETEDYIQLKKHCQIINNSAN